ncbi:MAG TPA: SPFH domain-containing protein [Steroidobacteraceae bacterium]|nr:SPFH domain-containing protein [Steroidobacteraceae bacterium]
MGNGFGEWMERMKDALARFGAWLGQQGGRGWRAGERGLVQARVVLGVLAVLGVAGWFLWRNPPLRTVGRGEVVVRRSVMTGKLSQFQSGSLWVMPGLYELRRFSTRDEVYRPVKSARANGEAPFQSVEGLSIGVDLVVRYAIDVPRLPQFAMTLPEDVSKDVVEPAVQGVIFKLFSRYTVREIFSTKRDEIQQAIARELAPVLAADGLALRSVQIGQVDLPQDYRNGMDKLLAEELESEKMRYTLELMDKRVKQTALEGEADKVRRQKAAEAAAQEQIIAAKAQEEAMKHVLPFKQKQVEQRGLEADADKLARIRTAEGTAEARRIEAAGEADSRQKLADAEAYRLEQVGKANSDQMARESELISKNPLLIQKTLADKLSDKVQVIIASPPAEGGFIGNTLLGAK